MLSVASTRTRPKSSAIITAPGEKCGLVGGIGLEIIGFPENATRDMLTPGMLNGLFFMTGPLYWIIVAVGMAFMAMYNLNERRHGGMMEELRVRRAAAAGGS